MAVIVEGWGVIARRTVVETALAEGLATWMDTAPNRMRCADLHLCLVAFMVRDDAAAFAMKLDAMGLRSG